jgi:hypothetical protein
MSSEPASLLVSSIVSRTLRTLTAVECYELFAVARTQSAVDPFLRFLDQVLLCLGSCPKDTVSLYHNIMEFQLLGVLDVGTAHPSARNFILIDGGENQVFAITNGH